MDELFNILSSSARIDKSKRRARHRKRETASVVVQTVSAPQPTDGDDGHGTLKSRDRTGKRDTSQAKLDQVRREQIASFRRSMNIKLGANRDKHTVPDPVSSFDEIVAPSWWKETTNHTNHDNHTSDKTGATSAATSSFRGIHRALLRNIEAGRWKEPTPIQMQSIPALLERCDVIGAAPTGSGKSGAFLLPALWLGSVSGDVFYGSTTGSDHHGSNTKPSKLSRRKSKDKTTTTSGGRQGEIRSLILAPSLELASQLHRELQRLGTGKQGGVSSTTLLLSKSNAALVIAGTAGGKRGLDCLVSTPLRLMDSMRKGLSLSAVRLVVLDEADRLLDATDGKNDRGRSKKNKSSDDNDDDSDDDDSETDNADETTAAVSGSTQSQTFLSQMDFILTHIPSTAVRGLFSATVTPMVRSLSESILRNPVDIAIVSSGNKAVGGANTDIQQELMFVGREEGKLLAIRQLVQRGDLRPPAIVFLQSQDRAQALFGELLYDGIRVDVIHAGRSKAARENAVAKFRKGETFVLICTDLVSRGVDFRAINMVINYDLPSSGVTYVHRIGRTGRAGRAGRAITLFTESDFDNLRTIANVMKQSGCEVPDWMLNMSRKRTDDGQKRRPAIDTTPWYDKKKRHKKQQMIKHNKNKTKASQSS